MPRTQRPAKARGRDYFLDPPAYQRVTRVEELDHRNPGLQKFVEEQLAAATPMRMIEALVKDQFGIRIPTRTIGEYRLKRWLPKLRRIQNHVERTEALMLLLQRYEGDCVARAQLSELLIKARQEGAPMRPEVAMRCQQGYMKLDIERQKVAVRAERAESGKQQVQLRAAKFRAEQAERRKRRKLPSQKELCATMSRAMGVQGKLVPRVEPEGEGDDRGSH